MSTSTEATKTAEASLGRDAINLARYYLGRYLGGRRGFIILAVAALAVGGALNWSWLVAAGIAPLLITALPCAAMCAIGLCKMGGKSCSTQSPAGGKAEGDTAAGRAAASETTNERN